MIQIPKVDIYPYWELVKRRKWWLIIPFLLVTFLGTGYIATAPKVYRASTLILVEAQRVPSRYVKSTISQDLRSRLHTITQQIKSRSYLKKVINRYELTKKKSPSNKNEFSNKISQYIEAIPFVAEKSASQYRENEERSMYSMVKMLRNKIDVSLHGRRNSAFEVSFEWSDPKIAADVANALASQFIEQNLNLRSEMAMGTTNFLSLQVRQLEDTLQKKENQLENFRQKHMGKLPGQLESNLNILNQLKEEKNNLEERIDREKQQVLFLRNQIKSAKNDGQSRFDKEGEGDGDVIANLRQQLEELKSKYTKKHPDVVALRERIQKMQNSVKKQEESASSRNSTSRDRKQYVNNAENSFQKQLAQTKTRIDRYEEQINKLNKQIHEYQQRVEQTPQVEMQLKDLQRNYNTVKQRYENLLSKKLDAQMAEELEKRQKGEQFKVVDSAIPPRMPVKPDVRKLGLLSLVLGLGIGGGLSYLRESLDPAFYTAEDAENQLGRKVLVSLPWEDLKE